MEIGLGLILFGLIYIFVVMFENYKLESDVKAYCLSKGLIYIGHTRVKRAGRVGRYGPTIPGIVELTFQRPGGDVETIDGEWYASWSGENVAFHRYVEADFNLPSSTTPTHSNQRSERAAAMTHIDSHQEASLASEVAKRLDEITKKPGWIHEYDLDGSGHIDSQEWETLRARVVEQVKSELSGQDFLQSLEPPQRSETVIVDPEVGVEAPRPEEDPRQDAVW